MPRNMSFMLTTDQIKNRTKTVTRRLGWWFLKGGEIVNAVEKGMGLKKGEKIVRICPIRIVSAKRVRLAPITQAEVDREGFPDWRPERFILFFVTHNKCRMRAYVNRIEFEYV